MITIAEADEVLRHLPNEFDSHDFIEKYLTVFERDYVNMLINNIDSTTIFRTVNATIGRFLSNNQGADICYNSIMKSILGIDEVGRGPWAGPLV